MEKLLNAFIKVEQSLQVAALVGALVFLGYVGFTNFRTVKTPAPVVSPTMPQ